MTGHARLSTALAACCAAMLLAGAGGASSASGGGGGAIVFASSLPVYPVPDNLDAEWIYSVGLDGRGRVNLSGDPGAAWDGLAALSPDGTKIALLRGYRSESCGGCHVSDLWLMNADGSDQRRLLSPVAKEGFPLTERAPAWSPDGTMIAVNAFSNAHCQPGPYKCTSSYYAVIVDLTGTRVGMTGFNPAWSPDGKRLAYQADVRVGDGTELDWRIGVSNADGSASRLLPAAEAIRRPRDYCWFLPTWSPDGRSIGFELKPCVGEFYPNQDRLYIAPVDGGTARMLAGGRHPAWSPDGSRLVFLRNIDERLVLFTARPDGGGAKRVTSPQLDATAPVWSPDSRWLAFQRSGDGSSQIYVADRTGTNLRRVTREPPSSLVRPFAWSRDSRRLLYVAMVATADSELWTMRPDGSGLRRLTSNGREDYDPAWSSDGLWLAFVHDHQPNAYSYNYFSIFAVRANGKGLRPITPGRVWDGSPAWSPDRRRIAFLRVTDTTDESERNDLFVVGADGSGLRRVTTGGDVLAPLAWSPNGEQIAFDAGDLFVLKLDGGRVRRLTSGGRSGGAAWSPDGSVIAFTRDSPNGGRWSIRIIRPDGSGMRVLFTGSGNRSDGVTWSRDGTRIAFTAGGSLYVMNRDGSGVAQIVAGGAHSPSWSPDGSKLVFAMGTPSGIYVVDADGGNLTALTPFAASSTTPRWSASAVVQGRAVVSGSTR